VVQADPRVTVGLAVYNGERFLAEALTSLVEQDYDDLEIVVADNASTDGTIEICEDFAARDPRVRLVRSAENRGISWNHNRLVNEARGEYFKWAACDDRYKPTFVSACVDVLDRHPDVMICYTNTVDIDADGRQIKAWPATNRASTEDPIDRFSDVVLNERECFLFYGLMRTEVLRSVPLLGHYSGSDHPFLAELALRGRFVEIPEPLFEHREHEGRSVTAYPNERDRLVLFRPNQTGKLSFPRWNQARGYVEVVARAPVPYRDKMRTLPALGVWARRSWRPLVLGVPAAARYAVRHRHERPAAARASLPN
jgi:glycosyltransferase involved in cell wall biosynthesis